MKALAVAVLLSSVTVARADVAQDLAVLGDQLQQAWYQDRDTKAWLLADGAGDGISPPPCTKTLAKLRAANAPAAATFEVRDASRDFLPGHHSLRSGARACETIDRQAKIKRFERSAQLAAEGIGGISTFEQCIALYDGLLAAGIQANEQVPQTKISTRNGMIEWRGTIEALRTTHCDGPLAKAKMGRDEKQAPYAKYLRAAKFEMARTGRMFTMPGGQSTNDPLRLAVAHVWFDVLSDLTGNESCPHGVKRKTLRRYQFDANHNLLGQTRRDYCGEIPATALN
jgi:hypothetical protein